MKNKIIVRAIYGNSKWYIFGRDIPIDCEGIENLDSDELYKVSFKNTNKLPSDALIGSAPTAYIELVPKSIKQYRIKKDHDEYKFEYIFNDNSTIMWL